MVRISPASSAQCDILRASRMCVKNVWSIIYVLVKPYDCIPRNKDARKKVDTSGMFFNLF